MLRAGIGDSKLAMAERSEALAVAPWFRVDGFMFNGGNASGKGTGRINMLSKRSEPETCPAFGRTQGPARQ
jgi:hypothetical protein